MRLYQATTTTGPVKQRFRTMTWINTKGTGNKMSVVKPAYDYLRKRLEVRIANPEDGPREVLNTPVANLNIAFRGI
jgi:hypothetical protein